MLPGAEELAPGFWRWEAFHEEWNHDVACVALDAEGALLLVDPLAPPGLRDARRFWKALDHAVGDRPVDVIVTLHYHRRSAVAVVGRCRGTKGAQLWAPVGSVKRLGAAVDRPFSPGDALPPGVEAFASGRADEVVLWLPGPRAVVAGDVLLGGERKPLRVCPASWLPRAASRAGVARALAPLTKLPVELVVPMHGPAVTKDSAAALAAALHEAR